MKCFFKTTLISILLLSSHPLYAQLEVESDFNREEGKLNVKLTNKSTFAMLFMTEHLTNPPSITIQSFGSNNNQIEWLIPPIKHGSQNLFKEYYLILRQDSTYLLSLNIEPDKSKPKPEYLEVTYNLPHFLYDIKNIDNEKLFLNERYKYFKDRQTLWFKEKFKYEAETGNSSRCCEK